MPKPITGTISGSSAATILGLNEYKTPFQEWQRITEDLEPGHNEAHGYTYEVFEGNAATRWGHAFEDANAKLTEEALGVTITDRERPYHWMDFPVSCHVDGIVDDDIIYEGKTTSQRAFSSKWTEDRIPRSYFIQVQHNMMATGRQKAVVAVLIFPKTPDEWEEMGWQADWWKWELRNAKVVTYPQKWATVLAQMGYHKIYQIDADEELQQTMLDKYKTWWTKHVIGRTPPEPMNVDDIKRMVPEPVGTVVLGDELLINALKEYREISKEISDTSTLGKRKKQLQTMFLDGLRNMEKVKDEESTDKWIIRDETGRKLAQWGKDKRGVWTLR